MKYLFITGLYRSGTTWLQKLLNQFPAINTFEQPCPPFYWLTKQAFLENISNNDFELPISHQLKEIYHPEDFDDWLGRFTVSPGFAEQIKNTATEFSGTGVLYKGKTPKISSPQPWISYWQMLHDHWVTFGANKKPMFLGSKEILGEEFCRFFIDSGVKTILIIRDPRAVIRSLVNDSKYMGAYRPTLYTLRMWRKSVAYLIDLTQHRNFIWIRYEDLKDNTQLKMNEIGEWLQLGKIEEEHNQLINDDGTIWQRNASVKEKRELPPNVQNYIEALCWPEMMYLGYLSNPPAISISEAWAAFKEPREATHRNFTQGYSTTMEHQLEEENRIALLGQFNVSPRNNHSWFIHPLAFQALHTLVKTGE